ncbi:MAG: M23 family metallopeptidase, partial [Myxococcota bacterium]
YKAGELGAIRVVFAAGDLRDFLARVYALRLLVQRDAELIATHKEQSEALAEAVRRAGQAAVELEEAAARLRERSAQLAGERRAKRLVVARIHESRARERGALIELETAARALEETLAALGDAPQAPAAAEAGPAFASLRGRLPSPVDAPITQEFGRVVDAEFSTETVRKGVVFEAPSGTPVRAVAAGLVRFAGWFRGYGRIVILGHGDDYFTVSGHLAEVGVAVGQRVPPAGAIGTVGDTGSLSGPRLYFEVRRRGQPLDPRQWLESPDAG